ncbi:MAG: ferritin family protein, partial [Thermoplasmata archaeon]
TQIYKEMGDVAEEEGLPEIAAQFRNIAKVERQHEKRYLKLLENVRGGKVFKVDAPMKWKCRNCGYVHEGTEPPEKCPACLHARAYFELLAENY